MLGEYIPLRKVGFKGFDDPADVGRQLRQQWDGRVIIGQTDLLDRYCRGILEIHTLFRIIGLDGYNVRVIHNVKRGGEVGPETQPTNSLVGFCDDKTPFLSGARINDYLCYDQEAVLVDVIEFLQNPEGILLEGGASVERLQSFNAGHSGCGDALYHGVCSGFVTVDCGKDRKGGLERRLNFGVLEQLPNQVIERGSLLIENLPDNYAKLWRQLLTVSEEKCIILASGSYCLRKE